MIIKYELDSKDIVRILAEHYSVPEENIEFDVHKFETGWEMAPVTKYQPYAIITTKMGKN